MADIQQKLQDVFSLNAEFFAWLDPSSAGNGLRVSRGQGSKSRWPTASSRQFATAQTNGVLGLACEPNTDGMRDAPSLDIIPALQAPRRTHQLYDPESMDEVGKMLTEVGFCAGPCHAIDGADFRVLIRVLINEWDHYRALELERVKKLLKTPVVVDLSNVYQPSDRDKRRFAYSSIGRWPNAS
jgi:UDP-N-acetyl-D-mannosaminuronate dehydrogenase